MLVCRDAEKAAIRRFLGSARRGHGRGLVLVGEPGIGKSALLAYARHQAKNTLVLSASGAEAESALPYATLQQLLRPVLGRAGRLPGPQAVALRVALGLEAAPAPDRFLVSLAALSLLAEATARLPVLCLVDDAQWADRPSLQAMAFVARRLESDPIALLAAARSGECGELEAAGTEVLTVPSLAPGAAAELLRRAARPSGAGRAGGLVRR